MAKHKKKCVTILITGEVGGDTVQKVHDAIRTAESNNRGLLIRICSPGGSVDDGFAIYDMIRTAAVPVATEVYGACCSIAVLIWSAAQHRHAAPETSIMLHTGNVDLNKRNLMESRALLDETTRQHVRYCQALSNATAGKTSLAKFIKLCKSETYFTAAEAKELGLATEIMEYTQ